jgi:hypothetical protein
MYININELLKYLEEQKCEINNSDCIGGYEYCLADIKHFKELEFNKMVNV